MSAITLIVADDQATVREALAVMLDLDADVDVVSPRPDSIPAPTRSGMRCGRDDTP